LPAWRPAAAVRLARTLGTAKHLTSSTISDVQNMRLIRSLSTVAVVLLLAGCAGSGPRLPTNAQATAEQGVLHLLRPQARGLAILSAIIDIDGKPTHTLQNGECVAIPLLPGQHTVTHRWKAGILGNADLEKASVSTSVLISQGKPSYVRLGVESSWSSSGTNVRNDWRWELREISATSADPDLKACRRGA
jgi:hypothetical protein